MYAKALMCPIFLRLVDPKLLYSLYDGWDQNTTPLGKNTKSVSRASSWAQNERWRNFFARQQYLKHGVETVFLFVSGTYFVGIRARAVITMYFCVDKKAVNGWRARRVHDIITI